MNFLGYHQGRKVWQVGNELFFEGEMIPQRSEFETFPHPVSSKADQVYPEIEEKITINAGQQREIVGSNIVEVARYQSSKARNLVAYVSALDPLDVNTPDTVNPYLGVAGTNVPPIGVLQQIEAVGILTYGFDGVSYKHRFNLPVGQVAKIPFCGAFARIEVRLEPRYYSRQGAGQGLFYINSNPQIRNSAFNNPPNGVLQTGFGNAALPGPVTVSGFFAEGDSPINPGGPNDRSARALRRFFGSLPTSIIPGDVIVACPIAWGANAFGLMTAPLTLPGGSYITTNAPTDLIAIIRTYNGTVYQSFPPLGAFYFSPASGALSSGSFYALPADATEILVAGLQASGGEQPFEILYDLGL